MRKYNENSCIKLDTAFLHFGKAPKLNFYGWDERLGAGFENPENAESHHAYSMLSIRTWNEFSSMMNQTGNAALAAKYKKYTELKIAKIREENNWTATFGLHAAAGSNHVS